jgi:hypothetical protein
MRGDGAHWLTPMTVKLNLPGRTVCSIERTYVAAVDRVSYSRAPCSRCPVWPGTTYSIKIQACMCACRKRGLLGERKYTS